MIPGTYPTKATTALAAPGPLLPAATAVSMPLPRNYLAHALPCVASWLPAHFLDFFAVMNCGVDPIQGGGDRNGGGGRRSSGGREDPSSARLRAIKQMVSGVSLCRAVPLWSWYITVCTSYAYRHALSCRPYLDVHSLSTNGKRARKFLLKILLIILISAKLTAEDLASTSSILLRGLSDGRTGGL